MVGDSSFLLSPVRVFLTVLVFLIMTVSNELR
jgi:hypothetical protein